MILRGEVILADLDPVVGREQGGRRPVLVLSPATYHAFPIGMAVIAPITSTHRRLPHHVTVGREAGLRTDPSFVMPEYVRALSQQRFIGQPLGSVSPETISVVERWVGRFTTEWHIR